MSMSSCCAYRIGCAQMLSCAFGCVSGSGSGTSCVKVCSMIAPMRKWVFLMQWRCTASDVAISSQRRIASTASAREQTELGWREKSIGR